MLRLVSTISIKGNYRRIFGLLQRGYKCETINGLIPGGGLKKFKNIKEEEYFSKKDNKIFENIKENPENYQMMEDFGCNPPYSKEVPKFQPTSSVKHKNLPEEVYFLNEHCDCIQKLKLKNSKENNS